jgi:hypothetical protein
VDRDPEWQTVSCCDRPVYRPDAWFCDV